MGGFCIIQVHKDPSEFQECLEKELDHVHGRLHIEETHSTWNFRAYFFKAGIAISGLAATQFEPDVCHVWQFTRRGALLDASILCQHEDWVALEPQAPAHCHSAKLSKNQCSAPPAPCHTTPPPSHPPTPYFLRQFHHLANMPTTLQAADVILSTREFMHSMKLSQDPVLMMPAQVVVSLQSYTLEVLPFSHVEESRLKDFKTNCRSSFSATVGLAEGTIISAFNVCTH